MSEVTLAIEFNVPSAIAKAIDNDFIGRYVEETLLADLQRFRKVALSQRRRARAKGITSLPDSASKGVAAPPDPAAKGVTASPDPAA